MRELLPPAVPTPDIPVPLAGAERAMRRGHALRTEHRRRVAGLSMAGAVLTGAGLRSVGGSPNSLRVDNPAGPGHTSESESPSATPDAGTGTPSPEPAGPGTSATPEPGSYESPEPAPSGSGTPSGEPAVLYAEGNQGNWSEDDGVDWAPYRREVVADRPGEACDVPTGPGIPVPDGDDGWCFRFDHPATVTSGSVTTFVVEGCRPDGSGDRTVRFDEGPQLVLQVGKDADPEPGWLGWVGEQSGGPVDVTVPDGSCLRWSVDWHGRFQDGDPAEPGSYVTEVDVNLGGPDTDRDPRTTAQLDGVLRIT